MILLDKNEQCNQNSRSQSDIIASWDKNHGLCIYFFQEFRHDGGSGHVWQVGKRVPLKANKSLGMPRAF